MNQNYQDENRMDNPGNLANPDSDTAENLHGLALTLHPFPDCLIIFFTILMPNSIFGQ